MKLRSKANAGLMAALLLSSSLAGMAAMAQQSGQATSAEASGASRSTSPDWLSYSPAGARGLAEIQAARQAIRAGNNDQATMLLTDAQSQLKGAEAIPVSQMTQSSQGGEAQTNQGADKLTDSGYLAIGQETMILETAHRQPQEQTGQTEDQTAGQSTGQSTAQPSGQSNGQQADQTAANQTGGQGQSDPQSPGALYTMDEIDLTRVVAFLPHDSTVKAVDDALSARQSGDTKGAEQHLAGIAGSIVYGTHMARAQMNGDQAQDPAQGQPQTQTN